MAVVKIINCKIKSWHNNYGLKPLETLSKGTLIYYKWVTKIGRREYLKRSKLKTKRFNKKNPSNLNFRVMKSTVLKGKNVKPELLLEIKNLIIKNNSAKGAKRYKDLTPKQLLNKMRNL